MKLFLEIRISTVFYFWISDYFEHKFLTNLGPALLCLHAHNASLASLIFGYGKTPIIIFGYVDIG